MQVFHVLYFFSVALYVWHFPSLAIRLRNTINRDTFTEELSENTEIEDFFVRNLPPPKSLPKPPINLFREEAANTIGCNVAKNGTLDYGLRPSSVIDTENYLANIESDAFFLRFPDGSDFKRFSLQAIQMPLETLVRSRECFRMFYKSSPITLCGANTSERDEWMSDLTEAVFCFNSKTAIVAPIIYEAGETIELQPVSTKDDRWKETLAEAEAAAKAKREKDGEIPESNEKKQTNEVEIIDLLEGKPQIYINGEKLPLYSGTKRDVDKMAEEEDASVET